MHGNVKHGPGFIAVAAVTFLFAAVTADGWAQEYPRFQQRCAHSKFMYTAMNVHTHIYRIAGNFCWCKFPHKLEISLRIKFRNLNFRNFLCMRWAFWNYTPFDMCYVEHWTQGALARLLKEPRTMNRASFTYFHARRRSCLVFRGKLGVRSSWLCSSLRIEIGTLLN